MQNLFSYPVTIDDLSANEKKYHIKAADKDLEYLKDVLQVPDVKAFSADISLKLNKKEHRLDVCGKVCAELELQSVISLEYFTKKYETEFSSVYDTKATYKEIKELELDFNDEAPEIIVNGKLDLVDVAIEQLALVMEDNPRQEGEVFSYKSEFDDADTQALNPFSVLSKLKK